MKAALYTKLIRESNKYFSLNIVSIMDQSSYYVPNYGVNFKSMTSDL